MAFDYNRNKNHSSGDSFWTSYSDLFLGLSTIFLLLYVTSSLRTGTDAIKAQVDNQKLSMQNEELKSQLKMYENVKTDYLNKEASKSEQQEYAELMDKLTMLKEEAKSDSERLARESLESEQKTQALNKYQQMIRNVINANKLAKTKIIARNDLIDEQDETIDTQNKDITSLHQDVEAKKAAIAEQEEKIADARNQLETNKKKLAAAYKAHQISKKQFEERQHKMQEQSDAKIQQMQAANRETTKQLSKLNSELQGTQQALIGTQQALTGTQAALAKKDAEATAAKGEAEGLRGQIDGIKSKFAADRAKERAAFEAELNKGKLDAAERARREGEFRAAAARKEGEMNAKIAGLSGKVAGLSGQLKDTEGQLAKAKEEMDARREVAKEIKKGFAAAGVKADVDMQTGEVVLDFGDSYFDSDSANLKPQMRDVIERAMPVYSKSLFGNAKVAKKISNVEIVGYASPTYKGRFVDPRSNKAEDKAALKYNMDLSYRRANSIFGYLVNNKDNEFAHQQDLLALMKVSGRSFLEVMKVQGRNPSTAAEFCKVNDCKKAQKVIVRFSMDGKK